MNSLHRELQPHVQPQPLTLERAVVILSEQTHRGESRWWIDSRQEFSSRTNRTQQVSVNCDGLKLHPFEAIAIAQAYLLNPKASCHSDTALTVALPSL